MIGTWQDAERCAAIWVRAMGHPDAAVTPPGADGGIDIAGRHVLAQVKFRTVKATRPEVQQLLGAAGRREVELFFFSTSGFTADALAWATGVGIAAFQLQFDGSIVPMNAPAARAHQVARMAYPNLRQVAAEVAPRYSRSGVPVSSAGTDMPSWWRRVGRWFARLFRTVAWEMLRTTEPEVTTDRMMTGQQLRRAGIGIVVFGLLGVIVMTDVALDPAERAAQGTGSAIGGVLFYLVVTAFGVWSVRLGARRKARHDALRRELPGS